MISSNLLELYLLQQGVEEDLEEHQHVSVLLADFLDPVHINLVGNILKAILEGCNVKIMPKCVNISSTKVDEETDFL